MGCGCKKKKQDKPAPQTVDQMIALELTEWDGGIEEFIDPILMDKIEQDEQGEQSNNG